MRSYVAYIARVAPRFAGTLMLAPVLAIGCAATGVRPPAEAIEPLEDEAQAAAEQTNVEFANAAAGSRVTVSSTSLDAEGESPPEALVDGDPLTRWSSAYAEPQTVELALDRPVASSRIVLHWETAAAREYRVEVSTDGETWATVHEKEDGALGPRTDEVKFEAREVRGIRLHLLRRVNPDWGFSLYQIQLIPEAAP